MKPLAIRSHLIALPGFQSRFAVGPPRKVSIRYEFGGLIVTCEDFFDVSDPPSEKTKSDPVLSIGRSENEFFNVAGSSTIILFSPGNASLYWTQVHEDECRKFELLDPVKQKEMSTKP